MKRRLASPDADTRSYPLPPPWMMLNISFDEPASFRWILQPVCCSNFFAKLGSVYCPHSMTLRAPSPGPIFVGSALVFETPAAGTASIATSPASTTCHERIRFLTFPP